MTLKAYDIKFLGEGPDEYIEICFNSEAEMGAFRQKFNMPESIYGSGWSDIGAICISVGMRDIPDELDIMLVDETYGEPTVSDETATILEFSTVTKESNVSDEKVELKAGDVVSLKSCGPPMTISGIDYINCAEVATCQWFVGNELREGKFPTDALELRNRTAMQ